MKDKFDQAKKLIEASNNILLTMHERMDGDDGGSILALARHLKKNGKVVTCAIKKGVPPNLRFLPGSRKIQDDIEHENFDLLITFGCSSLSRTGSEKIIRLRQDFEGQVGGQENLKTRPELAEGLKIINFDHHPDNEHFGEVNIVDAKNSSVAELVYDFFAYHKWPIDKDIATCLLTGIVTDTGSFKHSNTQESTLKAAAELLRKGATVEKIIEHAYKNKSSQTLKIWSKALENLHFDVKRKIIYSVITEKDLENIGSPSHGAFEGLTETLNTYPEAKFALVLRQEGEIIKGSLRTDPYKNFDVSQIAKIFGGGGHKMAAGFSVAGKLIKAETGKWKIV